jgi:predicted ATPase
MLAALTDQVIGLAASKPVLMILEDAHWIDPTTLESIDLTIARIETSRILLVITFRPEFQPRWLRLPHVTSVSLNRLTKRQVAEMVDGVTGGRAPPPTVLDQIIARTDGVPLFVEELTRMVLESGLLKEDEGGFVLEGPLPPMAIPWTLQDSLMARLDRLAPARSVAQTAAAIGRTFSHELLSSVVGTDPAKLAIPLGQLVDSGLLFRQGTGARARFTFKHALVQDAAYQSMLKSQRQRLHAQIGHAMEEHFPHIANSQPEVLAGHFAQAGLAEHAVHYWQRAGYLAMRRSAMAEAVAHLTQGLEALKNLPDTVDRQRSELALQVGLAETLVVTKGFAFPETGRAWSRSRELCEVLGDSKQLPRILFGQAALHLARANFERAREAGEELVLLGQVQADRLGQSAGHRAVGAAAYHLGDLAAAREHLHEALTLHDPNVNSALGYSYDTRVVSLCYLSSVLAFVGYLDQARALGREALSRAQELSHPGSEAFSRSFRFIVCQSCGDLRGTLEESDAYVRVVIGQQSIPMLVAEAKIMHGWALAETGQSAIGITHIREGLAAWLATRAKFYVPYFHAMLADALGRASRPKAERLRQLEKAIPQASRTKWHCGLAALYRQRGDVLAAGTDLDQAAAEADFRHAIAIARSQGAKLWELRAATSLGRLLHDRGNLADARNLLEPIYGWFTEGMDTPVLMEAKAILNSVR